MPRHPWQSLARDDSGAVLVYVVMALGVMIAMVSLSVNFGYRHAVLNRLQTAADAAALAGVTQLPNETNVRAQANLLASSNMPAADFNNQNKDVLLDSDIQIGTWDEGSRAFTLGGTTRNAVRVLVRRSAANANAHQLFMPGIFGAPETTSIEAEAIAFRRSAETVCYTDGFIAQGGTGKIKAGSGNRFSGSCLHGLEGVDVVGNTWSSAQVSARRLSLISPSSIPGATRLARTDELSRATNIVEIWNNFWARPPTPLPLFATNLQTRLPGDSSDCKTQRFFSGGVYQLTGKAEICGTYSVTNVVIIAQKEIIVKKFPTSSNINNVVNNVVLVSMDKVIIESDAKIGNIPYSSSFSGTSCSGISGSNFIAAVNNVEIGSKTSLSGLQMIVGGNLIVGSDVQFHGRVGAQVRNDITLGSSGHYRSCGTGATHILIGSGSPGVSSLVR